MNTSWWIINPLLRKCPLILYHLSVGIGISSPSAQLEISDENSRVIYSSSAYGNSQTDTSPIFLGRKARGSLLAPAAVINGDLLAYFGGKGFDGTDWDFLSTGGISIVATEIHDAVFKGTGMRFLTTPNGSTSKITRMAISHNGNVGIGTMNPLSKLAISGLPNTPPDASGNAGVVCVTNDGNLWIDDDGINDCQ